MSTLTGSFSRPSDRITRRVRSRPRAVINALRLAAAGQFVRRYSEHVFVQKMQDTTLEGQIGSTTMQPQRLAPSDPRIAWPLFTISEAADYLDMPVSTLTSWVHAEVHGVRLVTTLPHEGHQPSIPFIGFAEAFVLSAAKKAGVPAHRIRPNVAAIREEFPSIDHALASERIYTDGAELLVMRDEDQSGATEVPRLKQRQLTATVLDQLQLITYGQDGFARRLTLPKYESVTVTVDPLIASGRPLLHGTRVKDILDRYKGGDPQTEIAKAFGVPIKQVEAVIGNS